MIKLIASTSLLISLFMPLYNVVAGELPNVLNRTDLKGFNELYGEYLVTDIDKDGEDELLAFFRGEYSQNPDNLYTDFSVALYERYSNDTWEIKSSISRNDMKYLLPAVDWKERMIKHNCTSLFSDNEKLIHVVETGSELGKVLLFPVFFNGMYAVKVIGVSKGKLIQLEEIPGLELIVDSDKDGVYEFVGRVIENDRPLLSVNGMNFIYYVPGKNAFIKYNFINDKHFTLLFNKKQQKFNENGTLTNFIDVFLFLIAEKKERQAKLWYAKHNKTVLMSKESGDGYSKELVESIFRDLKKNYNL